jgi:hypothetical protein
VNSRPPHRLLRGVEIQLDEENFSFAAFSVVKWFKIAEGYSMDGALSEVRRRDLRGEGACVDLGQGGTT